MTTAFVIGEGLKGGYTLAWSKPQCTPDDICNLMRNVKCLGHDDLITLISNFTAMVQKPSALGSKCTSVAVDLFDEIIGQIEQDQIDQQAESAWAGRDDSWMQRQDVPGFEGTRQALNALTVRVAV